MPRGLGDALFGVGPVLSGVGLVVAGIAVLRVRRWTGPARCAPVAVGLYTLLVLIPIQVVSDGPPAPVALWTISGWDLLWFLLAAAVLATVGRDAAEANGMAADALNIRT